METDVKFCGLTRPEDARVGAELEARYLGVVFADGPRRITAERAVELFARAGDARRVAVFGAAEAGAIADTATRAGVDVIQLHGDPTPATVDAIRRQWRGRIWAVVRTAGELPESTAALFSVADAVVLDAAVGGRLGGTGVTLPWAAVARALDGFRGAAPLVLAGGLTPENVGAAIAALAPDVVDVSSGVEAAPGVKDHDRMRRFADAVRRAGASGGAAG